MSLFAAPNWCHLLWLSSAFDLLPHSHLLHKLSAHGISDACVNCLFVSCLFYSTPFELLSGVPEGSVLGLLLFNVFINGLCNSVEHSRYFLFADIKSFHTVSSATVQYNLTFIPFAVGVLLTVCNLMLTKVQSSPLEGKPVQLIIITNCVISA